MNQLTHGTVAPKNPRAINTKRNFIVKCKGKNWEVEERCIARQPCEFHLDWGHTVLMLRFLGVDPDLGSPRCWNDFDVEWDECPKGQVCEDKNGNFFEGYLYKPDD